MMTLSRAVPALLLGLLISGGALAQNAPVLPGPGITVVHLSERAERLVPRDRLRANLAVELTGANPRQIQEEINRRMEAALARARQVSSVKIETGGYFVYEQREPGKSVVWHGSQALILTSKAAGDLLALVGALQQQGLVTQGLAYELSPEATREAEDALTAQALAGLRRRAERVAADLNLAIEQLRDVTVGSAETNQRPILMQRMAVAGGVSPSPPPVAEPGDATVSVTVQAAVWLAARKP